MDDMPIATLFSAIIGWAEARGAKRIDQLPGCWEHDWTFDGMPAHVSINGHSEDAKNAAGWDVPPFTALLMINGWPAVFCDPRGGAIVGGEIGAEDKLIAALTPDAGE